MSGFYEVLGIVNKLSADKPRARFQFSLLLKIHARDVKVTFLSQLVLL